MRKGRHLHQRLHSTDLIVVAGWVGVFLILLAYGATSFKLFSPQSHWYLILNLTGSLGILLEAHHKKDKPALWLNIIWGVIALIGLVRFLLSI